MSTVAIPIETKVRELDGKIWLSLNLIENGHKVILGPSGEIYNSLDVSGPDIIVRKDAGGGSIDFIEQLQSTGIVVCALNTEGGVFSSPKKFAQNKKDVLNHIDAYFAWGQAPAEAIQRQYDSPTDNLYVTGNPRFDILQPTLRSFYERQATTYQEKYGEYVLVNGNFAMANPHGDHVLDKVEEIYDGIDRSKLNFSSRIFHLFLDTIHHMAAELEGLTIIVRPHPSEKNATHQREFQRYENVHVDDTGDVRAWIAGAQAVVHHDCTTGIESALMGTPTVSYRPIKEPTYEATLPQRVSDEVNSSDALCDYVSKAVSHSDPYVLSSDQKSELKRYFHNVDESAAENICEIINELEHPESTTVNELSPSFFDRLERRIKSSRWSTQAVGLYDTAHRLAGNPEKRRQRQYRKKKFPGLNKEELTETIEAFEDVADVGPVSIEAVPLTKNTFELQPE